MRIATNNLRLVCCAFAGLGLAIGAAQLVSRGAGASGLPNHSSATAKSPRPDEVTGEVTLTQSGSDSAPDASQVVVLLTPTGSTTMPHPNSDKPRYRLVQHNKRFEPGLLVVP